MDEELRDAIIIWLEERGADFRSLLTKSDDELISMMQEAGYTYTPADKDFVDENGETFWQEEPARV